MNRILLCLALLLSLAACAVKPAGPDDAAIARAAYVSNTPPSLTLFTVLNNHTNAGAHSGLMINASQRVLFDPAGTWYHPNLPERGDVHYGINDKMVAFYIDYHARESYRVIQQTVAVSPEQAETALRLAQNYGAVAKAHCALSISTILRDVPGLGITPTWGPKKLMAQFARIPGATERTITDSDADNNHGVLIVQAAESPAG